MNLKFSQITGLGCSLLILSACGQTSLLKSANVEVSTNANSETYLHLSSELNLGQATFAEADLDVIDPATSLRIGRVNFVQPTGSPVGLLKVDINTAVIPHADAELGLTLPNGSALPMSLGARPGQILGIPLLDHSIVYIGGNTKSSAYIGVALSIDGVEQLIGPIGSASNLFMGVQFTPQVFGVGGIFVGPGESSSLRSENGIAVFGKYTANPGQLQKNQLGKQKLEMDARIFKAEKGIRRIISQPRKLKFK